MALALPLFALTLFVSAFILFLVQPIIGKLTLPKLGGTPQVWNTCMVFFQMVLLLGYFYTHYVSTRLKPRLQLILHSVLLLVPLLVLLPGVLNRDAPFDFITKGWTPSNLGSNPVFDTLWILAVVVGIPFFVVSTSAPLLQKWFGYTGDPAAKDPYFLYGASNLGSMLSLILYPIVIEPFASLAQQGWVYFVGYLILVAFFYTCVYLVWKPTETLGQPERNPQAETPPALALESGVPDTAVASSAVATSVSAKAKVGKVRDVNVAMKTSANELPVDNWRRLRWIALAFVPSSMMLGVTSHITTDLSPIPLFWLITLSLYLLSFICVFARWPVEWVDVPHKVCVYLQPLAIVAMLLADYIPGEGGEKMFWPVIWSNILAFALTTFVCHGELAKDRPSSRYLTDFYLMMSVGGMLGGMYNGLIAPLFPFVIELNIAIMAACLLRPYVLNPLANVLDDFVGGSSAPSAPLVRSKGAKAAVLRAEPEPVPAGANISSALDWVVPGIIVLICAVLVFGFIGNGVDRSNRRVDSAVYLFAYGVPLLLACAFLFRPLRFGLAIAGIILVHEGNSFSQNDRTVFRDRSYFSVIRVTKSQFSFTTKKTKGGESETEPMEYYSLTHGHILHGANFRLKDGGLDWRRLATTYYHRKGPVGIVMEKYNWFHISDSNKDVVALRTESQFTSDNRIIAATVGQLSASLMGQGGLPGEAIVNLFSEPPYATIGLGTGTMGGYARPYQHCHFYEIDNQVRKLSLNDAEYFEDDKKSKATTYFNYLRLARERGAEIQVLMGDARLRMNLPYINYNEVKDGKRIGQEKGGGPENFYHMMVVDAFSSDAIPVHLLTKEAIRMYFKHLVKDGYLCYHTSNRYVNLPVVISTTVDAIQKEASEKMTQAKAELEAVEKSKGKGSNEYAEAAKTFARIEEQHGPFTQLTSLRGHDEGPGRDVHHTGKPDDERSSSEWVMIARHPDLLKSKKRNSDDIPIGLEGVLEKYYPNHKTWFKFTTVGIRPEARYVWTDDYHNLLFSLRYFTGHN